MLHDFNRRIVALAAGFGLAGWTAFASSAEQTKSTAGQPLAFPSAEGFGARATGGRGGDVYHVTNLNDSGPGSFRDAVSHGRRIVIFDVGGVIRLESNVSVSSDITIAGQSAPGDGIAVYGRSVSLSGSTNIVVRFVGQFTSTDNVFQQGN